MCARPVHVLPLRRRFCALLLVLVILSPCLQPYAAGAAPAPGSWTPPVVVDLGIAAVGGYAATAIVDGYPVITYFDETLLTCRYVRATNAEGTQWGFPAAINATGIITANICAYESLSVVNGNPAFSYINDGTLRYVRALDAVGAAWAASWTSLSPTWEMLTSGPPRYAAPQADLADSLRAAEQPNLGDSRR